MASSGEAVQSDIQQELIDYLRHTPKAVAVLFVSFFSGQLWVFIIFTYFKKNPKGNKALESVPGRTALGLAWFTFVMVPIHFLSHWTLNFSYENILSLEAV